MDFLKQLFGKKSESGPSKKGWLSIVVHRPSSRILSCSRGLLNHPARWGQVEFLVEQRLDECMRHYDFIPDEEIIGFIVENIEKVPPLDKAKPEAFERFLKGLKEEKRLSLREYQYRKESELKKDEPLPTQYQTWLRMQDSRELMNRHKTDLRDFKEEIGRHPFDTDKLIASMNSYVKDSQLFGKFISAIAEVGELSQRINLYLQLEKLIEESTLYKQSRIEEMDYFLMMPPEQMEPIHVLACETLRDELRKDNDGRIFGIPKAKLKGNKTYERLCQMMLDYHKYKGLPLDRIDDEYSMRMNSVKDMNSLVEGCRMQDEYDEEDSDAYPGMNVKAATNEVSLSVPIPMGQMLKAEIEKTSHQATSMKDPFDVSAYENEHKASDSTDKGTQTDTVPSQSMVSSEVMAQVIGPTASPVSEPVALAFDEMAEAAKSIQRLSAGALLRDEIFMWREHEAITEKQLGWAFAQPYITSDKLIQNGTLHGAVLKTRYFESLFNRVANDEENLDQLSSTDRNILLCYGSSMEQTLVEYEAMLQMNTADSPEYASISRQMASLLSEFGRIQQKVDTLRINEQKRLMNTAIEHAQRWLEHFFAGTTYALLDEEAFFQQFDDYQIYADYLRAILPTIERLGGQSAQLNKRSVKDLVDRLERYASMQGDRDSGAALVSQDRLTGLSPDQCGWGQVIYQLCFYIMERDRLREETQTDINAVCEMVELHFRLGKKIQGWMLHALYWVVDTESKVKRYCERVRKRYEYAWFCYQRDDKGRIEPYVMTDDDQQPTCLPLKDYLAQNVNRDFSRWFNAGEVWQWYCGTEAVPGGFVPSEDRSSEPKRQRARKPSAKAVAHESKTDKTERAVQSVATVTTQETEKTQETPAESDSKIEAVGSNTSTQPQSEGGESHGQSEETAQNADTVATQSDSNESQAEKGDQANEQTEQEKEEEKEQAPDGGESHEEETKEEQDASPKHKTRSSMDNDTDFSVNEYDAIASLELPVDTPTGEPEEDDEEDENLPTDSVIDEINDQEVEQQAELQEQAQELIDLFDRIVEMHNLEYDEDQQLIFGEDSEALAVESDTGRHWKWSESVVLSQLTSVERSDLTQWANNFNKSGLEYINEEMAMLICEPALLGHRIWQYLSRCADPIKEGQDLCLSWEALKLRLEKFERNRTLELLIDRVAKRKVIFGRCLKDYEEFLNEQNRENDDK